jgi:hypothetical protein
MKLELIIFAITAFVIYNTYYDGKYTKMFFAYKKYFQIAFFALVGISFYYMIKKNPDRTKNILLHANNMVKYMPFDKSSMDMLNPILDFTSSNNNVSFMDEITNDDDYSGTDDVRDSDDDDDDGYDDGYDDDDDER